MAVCHSNVAICHSHVAICHSNVAICHSNVAICHSHVAVRRSHVAVRRSHVAVHHPHVATLDPACQCREGVNEEFARALPGQRFHSEHVAKSGIYCLAEVPGRSADMDGTGNNTPQSYAAAMSAFDVIAMPCVLRDCANDCCADWTWVTWVGASVVGN